MGYYTFHTINIYSEPKEKSFLEEFDNTYQEIVGRLQEISDYGECLFQEEVKWYDWADHCRQVSSEFPDYYIEIYSDGESSDDYSSTLFHKGEEVARWYLEIDPPTIEEMLTKYKLEITKKY